MEEDLSKRFKIWNEVALSFFATIKGEIAGKEGDRIQEMFVTREFCQCAQKT